MASESQILGQNASFMGKILELKISPLPMCFSSKFPTSQVFTGYNFCDLLQLFDIQQFRIKMINRNEKKNNNPTQNPQKNHGPKISTHKCSSYTSLQKFREQKATAQLKFSTVSSIANNHTTYGHYGHIN